MAPDVTMPAGDVEPAPTETADGNGTCPRCGGPLRGVDARGARDVRAEPCGCRVGHVRVQRVFGTGDGLVPALTTPGD